MDKQRSKIAFIEEELNRMIGLGKDISLYDIDSALANLIMKEKNDILKVVNEAKRRNI